MEETALSESENTKSQTLTAFLGLRGLIVDGTLAPGSRVSEPLIVERFGVSRTPARAALAQLAEEGLLAKREKSGYEVKSYTEQDVFQAIEIRGILEGMAARLAAEADVSASHLQVMESVVTELDDVVGRLTTDSEQTEYVHLNNEFHRLLLEASESEMLAMSLERIKALPFGSPNAFVESLSLNHAAVKKVLIMAQEQHRAIVECIRKGEATRAERLAHEHSFCAARYLQLLRAKDEPIPWIAEKAKRANRK
ncbi:GntR family transcriptional regulator [Maritimibacter sp. UBA3975]|jgi:GntR family transcriptional regulator of vanillate catabolism|uniref:GntR family transcriptional regulator n=1 Tax=Maritimibacter sp. UBA3975 TaxID=1946833 RepID=UPI000C0935D3|nr:GntR family transcriptional regulator [Maritimibacter sp. UBA3975]MAM61394.1 GntR family transcriptional regulator [Maritimibacter sp.]|tara:strand:- start:6685 stop:7443 length:759 start_codon:yes stop_codon:yes gene_type:complete